MLLLSILFYTVGFVVCAWWFIGLLLFAFGARVWVGTGAPFLAKAWVVFTMAFIMPWHLLRHGHWPRVSLINADDPAEQRAQEEWLMRECGCDGCKAELRRRGK